MTSYDTDRTPWLCGRPVGAVPGPGRDQYPAAVAAMLPPGTELPPPPPCHRCDTAATVSWKRQATDTEREQHWAALEQHIRSIPDLLGAGNAEYTADRAQPVTQAVFGCDEHQVPDMVMLHAADCGGHEACQCESPS